MIHHITKTLPINVTIQFKYLINKTYLMVILVQRLMAHHFGQGDTHIISML